MLVSVEDQLAANSAQQLVKPTAITQRTQHIQSLRQRRVMNQQHPKVLLGLVEHFFQSLKLSPAQPAVCKRHR